MKTVQYVVLVIRLLIVWDWYNYVDGSTQTITSCISSSPSTGSSVLPRLVCDTQHVIWIISAYLAKTTNRLNPDFCTHPTSNLTSDCIVNVDDVTYDVIRQCATFSIGSIAVNVNNYVDRCSSVIEGYLYLNVVYGCAPITDANGKALNSIVMDTQASYGSQSGLIYLITSSYPSDWATDINQCRVVVPRGVSTVWSVLDARARLRSGQSQCAYQFYLNSPTTATYQQWCVQLGWRYQDIVLPAYKDGPQTFDVAFNPVISGSSEGQLWMMFNGSNADGSQASGINVTCGPNLVLQPVPTVTQTIGSSTVTSQSSRLPTTVSTNQSTRQSSTTTSNTKNMQGVTITNNQNQPITTQSVNTPPNQITVSSLNTPTNPTSVQSASSLPTTITMQSVKALGNISTSSQPTKIPTTPTTPPTYPTTRQNVNPTTTQRVISNVDKYSTTSGYILNNQSTTQIGGVLGISGNGGNKSGGGQLIVTQGFPTNSNTNTTTIQSEPDQLGANNNASQKLGLIIGLSIAGALLLVSILLIIFCILAARAKRKKAPAIADTPGDLIFAWDTHKLTDGAGDIQEEEKVGIPSLAYSPPTTHASTLPSTKSKVLDTPVTQTRPLDKNEGAYAEVRDINWSKDRPQSLSSYPYDQASSTFDRAMMSAAREHKYEQKQGTMPVLKHGVLTPSRPFQRASIKDLESRSIGDDAYVPFEDPSPYAGYATSTKNSSGAAKVRQSVVSGVSDSEEYTGTNLAAVLETKTPVPGRNTLSNNNDDAYINFTTKQDYDY